jgi:sodium--glutamate symport carrier gltS
MGLTMTSATLGLVIGGIVGGPVSSGLIRRVGVPLVVQQDGDVVGGTGEDAGDHPAR